MEQNVWQIRRVESRDRPRAIPSDERERNGVVAARVEEPGSVAKQPVNLDLASRRLEDDELDLAHCPEFSHTVSGERVWY